MNADNLLLFRKPRSTEFGPPFPSGEPGCLRAGRRVDSIVSFVFVTEKPDIKQHTERGVARWRITRCRSGGGF